MILLFLLNEGSSLAFVNDYPEASCRLDNFDDNVVDSQCLHWASLKTGNFRVIQ